MATYVEFTQEDGSLLLVEIDESAGQAIKASDADGNIIVKAERNFKDALKSVKSSVNALWQGLADFQVDEGEITFGIKTIGEVGVFAICKASAEANYEIRLKWTRRQQESIRN